MQKKSPKFVCCVYRTHILNRILLSYSLYHLLTLNCTQRRLQPISYSSEKHDVQLLNVSNLLQPSALASMVFLIAPPLTFRFLFRFALSLRRHTLCLVTTMTKGTSGRAVGIAWTRFPSKSHPISY